MAAWDDRLDHLRPAARPTTPRCPARRPTRSGSSCCARRGSRQHRRSAPGLTPAAHLASLGPKRHVVRRRGATRSTTSPRHRRPTLADARGRRRSAAADVSALRPRPSRPTGPGRRDRSLPHRAGGAASTLLDAEVDDRVDRGRRCARRARRRGPRRRVPSCCVGGLRACSATTSSSCRSISLPAGRGRRAGERRGRTRRRGDLTQHLTDPPPAGSGRDFPEDDWLHGVARVREQDAPPRERRPARRRAARGDGADADARSSCPTRTASRGWRWSCPPTATIAGERLLYNARRTRARSTRTQPLVRAAGRRVDRGDPATGR